MRNQNWKVVNQAIVMAAAALLVVNFTGFAAAQSEDVHADFMSAPKESTNVAGVKIFTGAPAGFNPLTATNHELAGYGLPQRPDQTAEPEAYALWERAMQAAKHRAPAKLDVKPYSSTAMKAGGLQGTNTSTTSYNWSGMAATNKDKSWNKKTSFDAVYSVFNVPVAQPPFGACGAGITGPFYEVSWNGIDGFSNGDVVQGGSLSAADCSGDTLYEAWVEWYPSYSIIGVFYVNPGDDIYVVTYGYPGTSTQYVFVEDFTMQEYGTYELPWLSGPGLVGSSAEWIVERPCCTGNGDPLALANTIYDFFNYDFAYDVAGKEFNAGGTATTNYNISMLTDNGSTIIESVGAGTAGEQGLESLWFYDENCAYSGGCTP
ncbi:MAG: G1 family glutamic endopeptidase [Terriglobales bacterium]